MIRHVVIVPLLFLLFAFFVGFVGHEKLGIKTAQGNVLHDMVGAKILSDADIAFQKIIAVNGSNVFFCKSDNQFLFDRANKTVRLLVQDYADCRMIAANDGALLNNGSGKMFAEFFDVLKEKSGE